MDKVFKFAVLFAIGLVLISIVVFSDNYTSTLRSVIRPAINTKVYKLWTILDGSEFCKDFSGSDKSPYDALGKIVDAKVDVIYLTKVDITSCKAFIQTISTKFYNYGLALAMNIDANPDPKQILGEDYSKYNPEYYSSKLKDMNSVTQWVSYLVYDNSSMNFTFSERRQIQSELREIFQQSFIGFRFVKTVTPTPENKHPTRNLDWNEFLPKDDDGDFIITTIPVSGFKRTLIFTEGLALQNADGDVVEIAK